MIGAKTLATWLLLLLTIAVGGWAGVLSPERLAARDIVALFFAGVFAVVTGTLAYRFFRLGERSAQFFAWSSEDFIWEDEAHFVGGKHKRVTLGANHGEAFDFPGPVQLAICVFVSLIAALGGIDSRALELLQRTGRGVTVSSFCPENDTRLQEVDPNAPGCELVRRAFTMGYVKDLGECGVIQKRIENSALCTLRQRDEPLLHYGYRLLGGFVDSTGKALGRFTNLWSEFTTRLAQLRSIRGSQRQVLSSAPHSQHHIWTNLPAPDSGAFAETTCADRYRLLPHRPPPGASPSKVFEHVLAQLLFESRYQAPAGTCREYVVHWNTPEDACERLEADAFGFLHEQGALATALSVLERWSLGKAQRALEPSQFLSFQCYMERPGDELRASRGFFIGEHKLSAEDTRVAPATDELRTDRYDALAAMLVRGFHYGRLLSEGGLEQTDIAATQNLIDGGDFTLSRLYALDNLDLFLEPRWLGTRADLLEVYPYQTHLKNYVRVFRRQYQRERGRL